MVEQTALSVNAKSLETIDDSKKCFSDSTSPSKATNNRMPGNIVCGICGAVRYYAFILQAKKFGTFSCEPCRKFISKTIKNLKNESENMTCVSGSGECVVPPVIRTTSATPQRKSDSGVEVRCQACWLKLCLIGYNLDEDLYDKLRLQLPEVIQKQLPTAANRSQSQSLLSHRGEILEFNRQVPLSRPLFDGFGQATSSGQGGGSSSGDKMQSHVVHERLPNGWTKKAVKRLDGEQQGKWDMYLITPDQKMLKSPSDLKLYIAKSGAVVDSNIVNFALPKKTARVDKSLKKSKAKEEPKSNEKINVEQKRESTKSRSNSPISREMKKLGYDNGETLPVTRTSRRETKVPMKYRDFSAEGRKAQQSKKISPTGVKMETKSEIVQNQKKEEKMEVDVVKVEPEVKPKSPTKSDSATKFKKLETIGVGTFSIDKDSVRCKEL